MRTVMLIVLLAWALPGPLEAAITGIVVDDVDGAPLANARVRIQTTLGEPMITGSDGSFTLTDVPAGSVMVTAAISHDSTQPVNYITGSSSASDGDHVEIRLTRVPADDRPNYDPGTSFTCVSCHFDQHDEWLQSTHANAANNEWVLDLFSGTGTPGGSAGYVFIDTHDPDDTGFCATCHAPIEDAQNPGGVFLHQVATAAGADGVTCLACHQMAEVNHNVEALHHLGNTLYRFPDTFDTEFWVWGPLDDVSFPIMRSSHQPVFSESRFCASCHEYNNPTTGAPGQNTFTEWLASPFSEPGDGFRACQDCHMPAADQPGPISSAGGAIVRDPSQRRAHTFTGATPTTLSEAIDLSVALAQPGNQLEIAATVANNGAGHHFPTGISIRNAMVHVEAYVNGVPLPQLAGPQIPFYGSAENGNQPADLAGRPGKGFARVLEGRINGQGPVVRPVLFIDAEAVWADTRIPSGAEDSSSYRFDLGGLSAGDEVEVSVRLLYRRAWRDLAETKGWTVTPTGGPIEIEVASFSDTWTIRQAAIVPVPSLDAWAMLALILALVLLSAGLIRRH